MRRSASVAAGCACMSFCLLVHKCGRDQPRFLASFAIDRGPRAAPMRQDDVEATMARRWMSFGAIIGAAIIGGGLVAGPASACAGLVTPGGNVRLVRTGTLAAYHGGVEHYITSFQFEGGGAEFGSIVPLPGIPSNVERAGDWTLQRLDRELNPPRSAGAPPPAGGGKPPARPPPGPPGEEDPSP